MSAVADSLAPAGRFGARLSAADEPAERFGVRLVTFAALAAYGTERWATLMSPAPGWRLGGVLALAIVLAGAVPVLRRFGSPIAGLVTFAVVLAAFPMAGLHWSWFVHERISVSANQIGDGLGALPNALVPYLGSSSSVRLVIVLGAAVLLLDAAAVIAFAPRAFGDARRAAAALPLVALAVVPSTLVRPQFPYLQGIVLFALVAAFVWAERIRSEAIGAALAVTAVVAVGAAIAAPRIDQRRPWVDYRAWAGSAPRHRVDTFSWNQSYGPLRWPRTGHVVMTVTAQRADYWKAENLDSFDGRAWVAGSTNLQPALPAPSASATARWSQKITVTIQGMKTSDVIAAGYAAQPLLNSGIAEGQDPGTWVAYSPLGPGTSYQVITYSPRPSAAQLSGAGNAYPEGLLASDLTLGIPGPASQPSQVTFPGFHSSAWPRLSPGTRGASMASTVKSSPYGSVYELAQRLAARSATRYGFVENVERYLSVSNGFRYDEDPPVSRYPLQSFLLQTKRGYCQQFSGAMAMLLRMGGVPARVAAGFSSGTRQGNSHQYVVTDIDAHAWVEVWFPRYGWVRFDPTPASAPALGGKLPVPLAASAGAASGIGQVTGRRNAGTGSTATTPTRSAHSRASGGMSIGPIIAGVAILAALAALAGMLLRRRGSTDDRLDELERALQRTRRPLPAGVTLASLEERFGASPGAAGYVRSLRLARYGGQSTTPTIEQRRALRRELALGLGFAGRWRALWALPPRLARREHRPSRS